MYVCGPVSAIVAPPTGAPLVSVTTPEIVAAVAGAFCGVGAVWANAGAMLNGPPASAQNTAMLKTRDE